MVGYRLAILSCALLAASAALAAPAPEPASTANLTITPSVTCRQGESSEIIRLSKANGDAIDAVFAFCRSPSLSSKAWIRQLKTTRDMLVRTTGDKAAKAAIRQAFADHIARERAAN